MKFSPFALVCSLALVSILSGCTTLRNRRDLYFPGKVEGPYTRMLQHRLSAPSPAHVPSSKANGSGKNVIKPRG
jgi:hypothetical protein